MPLNWKNRFTKSSEEKAEKKTDGRNNRNKKTAKKEADVKPLAEISDDDDSECSGWMDYLVQPNQIMNHMGPAN